MTETRVVHKDMPPSVKGLSVRCFDSGEIFYTVFINACLNCEQQQTALKHELDHIEHDDFSGCQTVDTVESLRHGEGRAF